MKVAIEVHNDANQIYKNLKRRALLKRSCYLPFLFFELTCLAIQKRISVKIKRHKDIPEVLLIAARAEGILIGEENDSLVGIPVMLPLPLFTSLALLLLPLSVKQCSTIHGCFFKDLGDILSLGLVLQHLK